LEKWDGVDVCLCCDEVEKGSELRIQDEATFFIFFLMETHSSLSFKRNVILSTV
jgi:hypothetical protein